MLQPLRGVGFVTDGVPFSLSYRRNRSLLVAPIAKTYHVYDTNQLRIIRVGPTMKNDVSAIAIHGSMEFVAQQDSGTVTALMCTKELWVGTHTTVGDVRYILPVHTHLMLTVASDRSVVAWSARSGEQLRTFSLDKDVQYTAASLPHKSFKKNKLLLGTSRGTVQLWNHVTGKKLWESAVLPSSKGAAGAAPVSCLAVCDYTPNVVAVGTESGNVVVVDFVQGIELIEFRHVDGSAVRGVAFSSSMLQLLVTGTDSGEVAVWDLNERTLRGVLTRNVQAQNVDNEERAHAGGCVHVEFLQYEPVVVTSGTDNAIRMYVFENGNKSGRLLRSRQGHSESVTSASFVDNARIATLSKDRSVRMAHVFSDLFNVELSQGRLRRIAKKKHMSVDDLRLPPARALASCLPRKDDWASIVTVHDSSRSARTWRMDNLVITKDVLDTTTAPSSAVATSVCTSRCGSLCVVGGSDGFITVFYLQTGKIRAHLQPHDSPISGVHILACNTKVVAVSRDGTISVSQLMTGEQVRSFKVPTGLGASCIHADAALLAVAADDFTIHVYDVSPDSTSGADSARVLRAHASTITSIALDPRTSRYLVSGSLDTTLCIWDLVTGALLARYRFETAPTSLGFDPEAQFLITTHTGCRGVYVWTNMMRYGVLTDHKAVWVGGKSNVDIEEKVPLLLFPNAAAEAEDDIPENERPDAKRGRDDDEDEAETFAKQREDAAEAEGLVTLSGLPKARVMSLPALDKIRQASKPILPPKQFAAPFFLPTTKELNPTFIVPRLPLGVDAAESAPRDTLESSDEIFMEHVLGGRHDLALDVIAGLPAARAALVIERTISYTEDLARGVADNEEDAAEIKKDKDHLGAMLRFFAYHIERRNRVDLVEACLQLFLNTFSAVILLWRDDVKEDLMLLRRNHEVGSAHMENLHYSNVALTRRMRGEV